MRFIAVDILADEGKAKIETISFGRLYLDLDRVVSVQQYNRFNSFAEDLWVIYTEDKTQILVSGETKNKILSHLPMEEST